MSLLFNASSFFFQVVTKINSDHRFDVDGFQYMIIREDRHDDMTDICMRHFFPDEVVARAVGLIVDDELRMFMLGAIKQNLSIALVSCQTQEIIGGRVITTANRDDNDDFDFKSKPTQLGIDVMAELDRRCNVFDHYTVNDIFNFFGLVVHRDYRRMGIGEKLMRAAVFFIQNLGLREVIIKGTASSNISQRLYEKVGFEMLSEMIYDEYRFEGVQILSNTGENTTQKLYGMKVN